MTILLSPLLSEFIARAIFCFFFHAFFMFICKSFY